MRLNFGPIPGPEVADQAPVMQDSGLRRRFVGLNAPTGNLFALGICNPTGVLGDEARGLFAHKFRQDDTFGLIDNQVVPLASPQLACESPASPSASEWCDEELGLASALITLSEASDSPLPGRYANCCPCLRLPGQLAQGLRIPAA